MPNWSRSRARLFPTSSGRDCDCCSWASIPASGPRPPRPTSHIRGTGSIPALFLGGVIDRPIDRGTGFTDDDRDYLVRRGIGITNLAKRATAKASELTTDELRRGGEALRALVRERAPAVVAVAGITAYRTAFGNAKVVLGEQAGGFEGARLWIVPNPSGLERARDRGDAGRRLSRAGDRRRPRVLNERGPVSAAGFQPVSRHDRTTARSRPSRRS